MPQSEMKGLKINLHEGDFDTNLAQLYKKALNCSAKQHRSCVSCTLWFQWLNHLEHGRMAIPSLDNLTHKQAIQMFKHLHCDRCVFEKLWARL